MLARLHLNQDQLIQRLAVHITGRVAALAARSWQGSVPSQVASRSSRRVSIGHVPSEVFEITVEVVVDRGS